MAVAVAVEVVVGVPSTADGTDVEAASVPVVEAWSALVAPVEAAAAETPIDSCAAPTATFPAAAAAAAAVTSVPSQAEAPPPRGECMSMMVELFRRCRAAPDCEDAGLV